MENGHLPKLTFRVVSTVVTKQGQILSASSSVWLSTLLNCFSTVTMSRHILEDIMGQGIFPIDDVDEATLYGRNRERSSVQMSCAVMLVLGAEEGAWQDMLLV